MYQKKVCIVLLREAKNLLFWWKMQSWCFDSIISDTFTHVGAWSAKVAFLTAQVVAFPMWTFSVPAVTCPCVFAVVSGWACHSPMLTMKNCLQWNFCAVFQPARGMDYFPCNIFMSPSLKQVFKAPCLDLSLYKGLSLPPRHCTMMQNNLVSVGVQCLQSSFGTLMLTDCPTS